MKIDIDTLTLSLGRTAALVGLMLSVTACPAPTPIEPPTGETEGETDATTGNPTTSDAPTGGMEGGTSGGEGQTSGTPTSGGSTSGEPTLDDSTGGPEGSEGSEGSGTGTTTLAEACESACGTFTMCVPEEFPEGPAECTQECVAEVGGIPDTEHECIEAYMALVQCIGDLSCEDLQGEEEYCLEQENAIEEACPFDECVVGEGGDPDGMTCGFFYDCPDLRQEMNCDEQTCTCLENNVEIGTCESMGVCISGEGLAELAETCCGF